MSLIQEALKRQQEESGDAPPAIPPPPLQDTKTPEGPASPEAAPPLPSADSDVPQPVPPPVPPPMPEPSSADAKTESESDSEEKVNLSQAPSPVKDTKPLKALVGIILLVVLLVGGLGYGIFYFLQEWKSGKTPATEASSQPDEDTPPEVTPDDETVANDATEPGNTTGDEVPDIVPVTEDAVPDITDTTNDTTPTDATTEDTTPVKEEVYWPELTLTGLLGKGRKGIALFGSSQVEVGDKIEGVLLVRIGDQGVLLEYKGESRFLKVNQSTTSE